MASAGRICNFGHVPSSVKKRAWVKLTDFAGLDAGPLAAARALTERLQSSIRPRGRAECRAGGSARIEVSASPCCTTAQLGLCWSIPCSRFRRYALMPGPRSSVDRAAVLEIGSWG